MDTEPYLAGTGADYGKIAGFFAAETLTGLWEFDEEFSGCETYVFINHTGGNQGFWDGDLSFIVNKTAPNTHYFFSGYGQPEQVKERVLSLKARMDAKLGSSPSISEDLAPRLHYVMTPATEIQGSIGAFFTKKVVRS